MSVGNVVTINNNVNLNVKKKWTLETHLYL